MSRTADGVLAHHINTMMSMGFLKTPFRLLEKPVAIPQAGQPQPHVRLRLHGTLIMQKGIKSADGFP